MEEQTESAKGAFYHVKILHSSATEVYNQDGSLELGIGDLVLVPTRYGLELGRIKGTVAHSDNREQKICRKATQADYERYELQKSKEASAFQICREKIQEHDLDMKLVSAHYCIDEKKILFYFTAESRVDFRQLVKDLVSVFKTRIELRQIGVRDEARVLGGMGVCGRTFCCHGVTDKLRAVSIKMAKEQNLTLNSMKISGPCGRLLCCLAYEYDTYRECRKVLPSEGTRIRTGRGTLRVVDINIFHRQAKLEDEEGNTLLLPFDKFYHDSKRDQWRIQEDGSGDRD
jgi:cell fate regulator YaaT (PSP1 superfamily)